MPRDAALRWISESTLAMELPDTVADVLDLLVRERGIHWQQETTCEQSVRIWETSICETQAIELVHGRAGPLDDRADTVVFQLFTQVVAPSRFHFIVLIDIEVVRIIVRPGWKNEILQTLQTLAITSRNLTAALDFGFQL